MKRILIAMALLVVLAGCGAKEKEVKDPNSVKLSNGLVVTKDSMDLTDSYGDLIATDSAAALVLHFTAENTSEKSQSFGSSVVNLYINDELYTAEMLSGGSDALDFFVDVEPKTSVSGALVFGVQISFSESDEVKLVFTDVLGTELGEMKLEVQGLTKTITSVTQKADDVVVKNGMQTTDFMGANVSVGNMQVATDEELQKTYPDLASLKRGYLFVVFDFSLENNTDAAMDASQALLLGLIDNYDDLVTNEEVYARAMGDDAIDQKTEIAVGETRSGKVLFVIRDDVTSVTVEAKPHRPTNKNTVHFEFEIPKQ